MIDERTGLEIMDEEECWKLLGQSEVGRIAVAIANKPDVFPVNYKLDGEDIYIHTIPGTKLAAAILGPGVCFEIDELDEDHHLGWSVVVHGSGSEVEGTEEIMRVEELGIKPWTDTVKLRYLRIHVDDISGRRVPASVG